MKLQYVKTLNLCTCVLEIYYSYITIYHKKQKRPSQVLNHVKEKHYLVKITQNYKSLEKYVLSKQWIGPDIYLKKT